MPQAAFEAMPKDFGGVAARACVSCQWISREFNFKFTSRSAYQMHRKRRVEVKGPGFPLASTPGQAAAGYSASACPVALSIIKRNPTEKYNVGT